MQRPNAPSHAPPCVLTIAGSDSGGGAGIQADLHTFAAFATHGLSAITAITAQNTCAVEALHMVPTHMLRAQLDALFEDFPITAVKTGMLGTAAIARVLAAALDTHRPPYVVLDPVLIATTGGKLSRAGLTPAVRRHLLPRATVVTPNIPEAEDLVGMTIDDREAMRTAAQRLRELGAPAVLLKGGHLPAGSEVHDLLLDGEREYWFSNERIDAEGHGTGCTLASALAANLALGKTLPEATGIAIDYVHRALSHGYKPGKGNIRVLEFRVASRNPETKL